MGDVYERRKEIFFTNLLMLGFDVSYMEKKYAIPFNKDMFNVPNQKAFEVVTHFLFTKLNEITKEDYKIMWPVLDKIQEREFMKTCKTHLNKISKENTEMVRFPHVGQTLMSPGGSHKFYELYMAFSSYIMQRIIAKDKVCYQLCRPTINAGNYKDVKEVMMLSTIKSTKEYVETQKATVDCHRKWHETAQHFVSYYKKTKRDNAELQKRWGEVLESLPITCDDIGSLSEEEKFNLALNNSSEMLEEVKEGWSVLEKQLSREKSLWDIIRCAFESECPDKVILDGQKYISPIPDILKTKYKKELQEHAVQSLTENDKLSLKNFLGLHQVNVQHYRKLLDEDGLPNVGGLSTELEKCIQALKDILEHSSTLSNSLLLNVLPDVSENKKRFETTAYADVSKEDIENMIQKLPSLSSFSLDLRNDLQEPPKDFKFSWQLSPESERQFDEYLKTSEQQPKIRLFETPTSNSADSGVFGLSERFSNMGMSVCRNLEKFRKEFSLGASTVERSDKTTKMKTDLENFLSGINLDESVSSPLSLPSNRYKTYSAGNSFNISSDEGNFNPVEKKYIQHLVSKLKIDSTSSDEESAALSNSRDSDFMGARAFHCKDKVLRTPPVSNETEPDSSTQPRSGSEGFPEGDEVFQSPDVNNFRRLSWPDEEEFLENATLPDVPILL